MFANINFQDIYWQKSKIYLNCDNNTTKQSLDRRNKLYRLKMFDKSFTRALLISLLRKTY